MSSAEEREKERIIDVALSKIKDEDIIHRGFLSPIEISLRTYESERHNLEDNIEDTKTRNIKSGSLPRGVKVVIKNSINDNKFTLRSIESIQGNQKDFNLIQQNNQDNLLALMKRNQGIQLAICICMYSEDKIMLKSTLAGVRQNIDSLVRTGVDADSIGVFVLMDGIEKVNSTVVDFFEELERQNGINLGEHAESSYDVNQIVRLSKLQRREAEEEDMKNVTKLLFTNAEIVDRNERRFCNVKKQYTTNKELLTQIEKLAKQKPMYDNLPTRLRPFFIDEARKMKKEEYDLSDVDLLKYSEEKLIEEYAYDVKKCRVLVMNALQEAKRQILQYFKTREDLSYLASFRTKIRMNILQPQNNQKSERASKPKEGAQKYHEEEGSAEYLAEEVSEEDCTTFMNLFMCVKYKNAGKLSSHNWFFNGFCRELEPKYAVLLDVGLRPHREALYRMYKHLNQNQNIGGVCGYMSLKIEQANQTEQVKEEELDLLSYIALKFVDIQRTQQVEYHFAHLMDKPFQSSFDFIHVLPGAFSAYNMDSLLPKKKDEEDDDSLLKEYFKSIDQKLKNNKIVPSNFSIGNILLRVFLPDFINQCCISIDPNSQEQMLYNENIFLAEDRILCMGIHKNKKGMTFLPDAYAEVDPIKTVHGLLGQRKRWINGSFFAFEKVKRELGNFQKQQGNSYECFLHMQIFYLTFMNFMAYFAPALFLFTVHIAMEAFRSDVLPKLLTGVVAEGSQFFNAFVYTIDFIYVMMITSVIFFSLHLTNNNQKFRSFVYFVSTLFGIFSLIVFAVLIVDVIRGLIDQTSFLQTNASLISYELPGGISIIDILRYIIIGIMGIYAIPIIIYQILFCKSKIIFEVILGIFSFVFYSPTYLNILNIYALCRIDDISWGTKGLDASSNKNAHLKDTWRIVKYIHVSKYVIWNIIIGTVLLSLGSSYKSRFFLTFAVMVLIGLTLMFKIFVASLYMIFYRCKHKVPMPDQGFHLQPRSSISDKMKHFERGIRQEIKSNLKTVADSYADNKFQGSFIMATQNKKVVEKSFKKKQLQTQSRIYKASGSKVNQPPKTNQKKKEQYKQQLKKISQQEKSMDQSGFPLKGEVTVTEVKKVEKSFKKSGK